MANTMPHEVFSTINDPQLRRVCSEIFTADFSYVPTTGNKQRGEGPDFFAAPDIELLTLQVSYLESSPQDQLVAPQKFATLGAVDLPSSAQLTEQYTASVGGLQRMAVSKEMATVFANMSEFNNEGWPAVRQWYERQVAQRGNSLLAAHVVGRDRESGTLIDAITYPTHIRQKMGALARTAFTSTLSGYSPEMQETIKERLIHNAAVHRLIGDIAASMQLIDHEDFTNIVGFVLDYNSSKD